MSDRQIVAVASGTEHELLLLGEGFSRAWSIDTTPCFDALLQAIDEAERELWQGSEITSLSHVRVISA